MPRSIAIAAILALSTLATRAETLSEQVHSAAAKICAAKYAGNRPAFFYGSMERACTDQVSIFAMRQIAANAQARTRASAASIAGN